MDPEPFSETGRCRMISGGPVHRLWQKIPCKTMLAVIAACLLIGEAYPFSDFPMFGSFSGKTYYVYLADENGKAIPAMDFGVPTNGIKKAYDAGLQRIKKTLPKKGRITPAQDRAVAEETLRYLARRRPATSGPAGLRLMRVDLRKGKNGVLQETRTAGELSLR